MRRFNPQTLAFLELRNQKDVELIERAYHLHTSFGDGLMPDFGAVYRREFDMGNSSFQFRNRAWLRRHGCTQQHGELWRSAGADWYASRGYVRLPVVRWYVLFQDGKVIEHRVPWRVKSAKSIKLSDLDEFDLSIDLGKGTRFLAKTSTDEVFSVVFVPSTARRDSDLPAYVPGRKKVGDFTIANDAIRPGGDFLPLMEGKWTYHYDSKAYAYVTGSGSWVTTRPRSSVEDEVIPQYFISDLDANLRTSDVELKPVFRTLANPVNERTFVASVCEGRLPCSDKLPSLHTRAPLKSPQLAFWLAWANSFVTDFFVRLFANGEMKLFALKALPAPLLDNATGENIMPHIERAKAAPDCTGWERAESRALLDAVMANRFELTPSEYAYVLSKFPLLDRDQPPLAHDYRIRARNKGTEWRKISFITRDLALLTYFDYLAGRLDVKPDPERMHRICPDGVPEPPKDIVEFFAEAGVDIGGQSEHSVASTGPYRNLRERIALAKELGAVAYIPTIDRRRATFVEQAAAAGGLSPDEGVLTPEMAKRVLRDKADREAKWARAMKLWDETPDPWKAVDSQILEVA